MGIFSIDTKHLLFLLYLIFQIKTESGYGSDDFIFRLEGLLNELEREYSMTDTIVRARIKLQNKTFETLTQRNAALIIYLYTSSEEISDEPRQTFYSSLNNELRSENTSELWLKCETLLNEALDIIGLETFGHLYRGERYWPASFPDEGDIYHIPSFWSSTLDPTVTRYFGGTEGIFYHILGAKGVFIQHISVIDEEKEVLIQSKSDYILVKKVDEPKEIRREMERIKNINSGFDVTTFSPKIVITLMDKSVYSRMSTSTPFSDHKTSTGLLSNSHRCALPVKYNFALFIALVFVIMYNITRE